MVTKTGSSLFDLLLIQRDCLLSDLYLHGLDDLFLTGFLQFHSQFVPISIRTDQLDNLPGIQMGVSETV